MNWTTEQQQAIDETGTNIIVSAGAGSGKTAVLSARVMRILSSNIHINELLILTFTKAAAAEMKERIRKNIKKSIKTNPKLNHELELIDQSYITTFDSFALSVVKKYHYLLNISNDISISDSSIIAMKKNNILDEIFDEYYQSDNESFKKLIYDFCVKDDSEIKKQILSISDKIDGRPDRDEYLKNYMSTYFNDNHIAECINKYEHLLLEKLSTISDLTYELSFYSESIDVEKLNTSISPLLKCHTIDDIYKVISTIKLPSLKRGAEDEAKQVKEELKDNIDKLKDIVLEYKDTESLKSSISQTKIYTEIIVEIITNFLNRFHTYKEQNNLYDFQDIALLSIKILKEHKEVAEELKQSFKEIMIDEYQDTNEIQENLILKIARFQQPEINRFMVGDMKQSIYRFR
ncbi:MAG TPA: hypothetical protein DCE23_01570, partial [Firmicutes bacterium]|nr:hypothetical protein [Bacillota bacterium]